MTHPTGACLHPVPRRLPPRTGLALLLIVAAALVPTTARAALNLSTAKVFELANGMTVAVLEEPTIPVVSVQMLYKVGARNEQIGRTGLAHFLEHMAFRATESFPETEVVSAIYAVGGEWHGYTWIDQTTYFETLPRAHLDLALRIEAERMAHLRIPQSQIEAERGAVLSELHGYENDPGTVLLDAVAAASFSQHPYRHNTIGWQSDVERVQHADLVDFYRRHYHPANAVLAVVGDVRIEEVRRRVTELFASHEKRPETDPVRTVEPVQRGERRLRVEGQGGSRRFVWAYRAPEVGHADWPAFLLLQEILGGGEGVNFLQNDWGVAVRSGTRLDGLTKDLSTWYPPAASPYLFVISGSLPAEGSVTDLEVVLEEQIERLRRQPVLPQELASAKARLQEQLIFDLQTTEDAAHQLASYLGYGALRNLLELPEAIEQVDADEIRRVASRYLLAQRRTVGWYIPVPRAAEVEVENLSETASAKDARTKSIGKVPAPQSRSGSAIASPESAVVGTLSSGLPVLLQRVSLTPTAHLRLLVPSTGVEFAGDARVHAPVWGWTSLERQFLSVDMDTALREVRTGLDESTPRDPVDLETIQDPNQRLEAAFEELLGVGPRRVEKRPAAVVLVGDLEESIALETLERHFGNVDPAPRPTARPLSLRQSDFAVRVEVPKAQASLGYVVPAPLPGLGDALVWRVLLYVLSHGYEGRLGVEAISRRGLVYYIDSSYRSDGRAAWIALKIAVDPDKLGTMRSLLVRSLSELERRPPTEAEIGEARDHLIGRWRSAAQSNPEISAKLAQEWLTRGRVTREEEFVAAVRRVTRADVLGAIPDFIAGAVVMVEVPD